MSNDVRALLRVARRQGAEVVQRRRGHWLVRGPKGSTTVSNTASDRNAVWAVRRSLRDIGIEVRR